MGVIGLTAISSIDQTRTRGIIWARRDGTKVFRRAMRHSRRVRFLRWAVPIGLVGAACASIAIGRLGPMRILGKFPVDFSSLVISGTKITMQAPRLSGYTRDSRPYEFRAQAAAQDVTKPDKLELQGVHGKSELRDRSVVDVTAQSGIYDIKTEMMSLRQNVVLKSSSGLEVRLSEALVDTRAGNVTSEAPVEVHMPQGTINANRLEVVDSGDEIRFENGVTAVMMAPHGSPAMHARAEAR
jgi:lipopolysaccharide export system protein LptC